MVTSPSKINTSLIKNKERNRIRDGTASCRVTQPPEGKQDGTTTSPGAKTKRNKWVCRRKIAVVQHNFPGLTKANKPQRWTLKLLGREEVENGVWFVDNTPEAVTPQTREVRAQKYQPF